MGWIDRLRHTWTLGQRHTDMLWRVGTADGEEPRSRQGQPYTATRGRDRVDDFGRSYDGLITGVSVEGTHDFGEEDVECDGSGAGFCNCVKLQMDTALECRTQAREGDAYRAHCEQWRH